MRNNGPESEWSLRRLGARLGRVGICGQLGVLARTIGCVTDKAVLIGYILDEPLSSCEQSRIADPLKALDEWAYVRYTLGLTPSVPGAAVAS
jgi:hypothetical protein